MHEATTEVETWMPVKGYEGLYEVSDQGAVKSLARKVWNPRGFHAHRSERALTPSTTGPRRVPMVKLYGADGTKRSIPVHKLVLEAFVGPCPPGMECCHADDDPSNNTVENLRWDTHSANIRDQVRNGAHNMASKTHCPEGHPLAGDNLLQYGHSRVCKTCRREWRRNYYLKKGM